MKTRTISIIFSAIVICGLLFLFQKKLSCQSSQINVENTENQSLVVSIPAPAVFPTPSTLYAEMWGEPEYVVLNEIPEGVKKHFLGQPVLTDKEIFIPVIAANPGILIYERGGSLKKHIRIESISGQDVSAIRVYPDIQEIMIGDNANQRISVYDLSGNQKEVREVGFHFMSFMYSPELKRYIFYLVSDGAVATAADPPDAITITDASFNVIQTCFPLSHRTLQAPYFTDGRFHTGDGLVYYNPDFSDQLYSIDFMGKIELILDLQLADEAYYSRLDSLLIRVNNFDYYTAFKRSLCIDYYVANDGYVFVGNIPSKHNKDLMVNRRKHQGVLIHNSILMTNFGDRFNFGYSRPHFATEKGFMFFFTGNEFNSMMERIPSRDAFRHLPDYLSENQWLLMIFNPNDKVFFPDIEKPTPESQVSLSLYPNPASESVKVQVAGTQQNIRIDVYATDGTIRFTESRKESEAGMAREIEVADWVPGAYIVKCTTSDAVYARTLIVQ